MGTALHILPTSKVTKIRSKCLFIFGEKLLVEFVQTQIPAEFFLLQVYIKSSKLLAAKILTFMFYP